MLYAILCYNDEKITTTWSKAEDDAVMARLQTVHDKLEAQGKLGPTARNPFGVHWSLGQSPN